MVVYGWIIASIGVVGLVGSVVMEIIRKEPIYMTLMKLSAGATGIGGIILFILSLD